MRRLLLAALVLCFGCKKSGSAAAPGSGEAPVVKTAITIGATLPLTGAEARIGGFYKEGYELAVEQANKAGGLNVGGKKVPVSLILLDDTSTQATAVSLADRLITSDKVDALLGTYSSHLVEAQSAIAEENKIPYVNGGGGATGLYKHGYKYLFGLMAPVELLGDALMQWIDGQQAAGKVPKQAKIALVWENTAHGKDFRKGVSDFAKGKGYQVVVDESFELNAKDFSALLNKVKSENADIFLADAHLADYITMHRQYVTAGLCHKIISYGARGSEKQAADALGPKNVQYILSAVWWNAQLGQKGLTKDFVDAFKARYGRAPDWYQALAYETARALFAGIEKAGTTDHEKIREQLAKLSGDSILPEGKLSFPADQGQQAHYAFVVQQNQPDGSSPIVWPKSVANAAGVAPNPDCAK
jgi:branched-chain amino acid transport system substrate-binding protein